MVKMQDAERPLGGTLNADSRWSNGARRPAGLTSRQRLFVQAYLVDLNAAEAARQAGYSAKTAVTQGSRLYRNVHVRAAITAAMAARAQRLEVKADRVVLEAARIAFADLGRVVRWGKHGVRLVESTALSPDDRAAVASVQERRDKGKFARALALAEALPRARRRVTTALREEGLGREPAQLGPSQPAVDRRLEAPLLAVDDLAGREHREARGHLRDLPRGAGRVRAAFASTGGEGVGRGAL